MDITGLKYSQVSSLLLYFSPSLIFFPEKKEILKYKTWTDLLVWVSTGTGWMEANEGQNKN